MLPLIEATEQPLNGTLAGAGLRYEQLTRSLRDALHQVLRRLQWGQTVLATAGSIAPFVGLLGTVWGIFNALTGMAEAGQLTVDKIAGPVGDALVVVLVLHDGANCRVAGRLTWRPRVQRHGRIQREAGRAFWAIKPMRERPACWASAMTSTSLP